MANYGRFDVIQFPSFYVVTDMEQHTWVSEQSADIEKVRCEARHLEKIFKEVPTASAPRLSRLITLSLLIEHKPLRGAVRRIIEAAAENADEYLAEDADEDEGDDASIWDDVFDGSIETECDDASPDVAQWFRSLNAKRDPDNQENNV